MTTTAPLFAPAKSCSTTWVNAGQEVSIGVRCSSGTLINDQACYPDTKLANTACPQSWKSVDLEGSTTTCCPNEYTQRTKSERCFSSAGGFLLEGVTCDVRVAPTSVTKTYTFVPGVWAQPISYVDTTTPPSTTSPTTSASVPNTTASSLSTTTTSASPSVPSSPSTPSSKTALSGGVIAGIAIGSVIAVSLILVLILLLRRRIREPRAALDQQSLAHTSDKGHVTNLELDAQHTAQYEADTGLPSKLYAPPFKAEAVELGAADPVMHGGRR